MNSYYFSVLCYRRKRLQWVVEMSELSHVATFLIASEKNRTKHNAECEIHIRKDFVSARGAYVVLDQFSADDVKDLNRIALEATS